MALVDKTWLKLLAVIGVLEINLQESKMKGTNEIHLSTDALKDLIQDQINKLFPENTPLVYDIELDRYASKVKITLVESKNNNNPSIDTAIDEVKKYSCTTVNAVEDPIANAYRDGYNSAVVQIVEGLEKLKETQ